MIANCFTFAIGRYVTRGGYIIVHRSKYGWWPHLIWSPDLVTFEQFHPVRHRRWYAWALRHHIPLLLFNGRAHPWTPE